MDDRLRQPRGIPQGGQYADEHRGTGIIDDLPAPPNMTIVATPSRGHDSTDSFDDKFARFDEHMSELGFTRVANVSGIWNNERERSAMYMGHVDDIHDIKALDRLGTRIANQWNQDSVMLVVDDPDGLDRLVSYDVDYETANRVCQRMLDLHKDDPDYGLGASYADGRLTMADVADFGGLDPDDIDMFAMMSESQARRSSPCRILFPELDDEHKANQKRRDAEDKAYAMLEGSIDSHAPPESDKAEGSSHSHKSLVDWLNRHI